jgi:hypothetical protein
VLNRQTFQQQFVNKLIRRHRAQALVKGQAQHPVDTLLLQQAHFLTKACQPWRRIMATEELARLRLKDNDHSRQIQLRTFSQDLLQNLLVTKMHTIKVADRCNTAFMLVAQIMQTPNQFHVTSARINQK